MHDIFTTGEDEMNRFLPCASNVPFGVTRSWGDAFVRNYRL